MREPCRIMTQSTQFWSIISWLVVTLSMLMMMDPFSLTELRWLFLNSQSVSCKNNWKTFLDWCKTCPVLLRCLWMHRFAQIKKCTRCVSFESWLDRRGSLYANRCYRWPLWSLMEKAWSVRSVLSWWSELSGHHFLEPKTNHCSIRCRFLSDTGFRDCLFFLVQDCVVTFLGIWTPSSQFQLSCTCHAHASKTLKSQEMVMTGTDDWSHFSLRWSFPSCSLSYCSPSNKSIQKFYGWYHVMVWSLASYSRRCLGRSADHFAGPWSQTERDQNYFPSCKTLAKDQPNIKISTYV